MRTTPEILALIDKLPDDYYAEFMRSLEKLKQKAELAEIHHKIQTSLADGVRPSGLLTGKMVYTSDCFEPESESVFELD